MDTATLTAPPRTGTAPSNASAIRLTGVTKRYGALTAVDDLSLDIPRGRTVALLGQNGAGKSTTVGMLMGLIEPDSGTVQVGGGAPRAAVTGGRIAAMLQDCGLMPGVTVAELVELGRRLYPAPLATAAALDLAGLSGLARRRVDRLSGGQAQRLKFALVAVANPDTMLLDEPTRALDVQGRREFWTAMRAFAESGRTIVFATHYLDEVEQNADRVVVMAHGRIIADGTPAEIRAASGGATVRFRLSGPSEATAPSPTTAAAPTTTTTALAATTGTALATPNSFSPALALPGTITREGDRVTIRTDDPDATVRALAASDLPWRDLTVAPPSLDDSFLHLTAEK
ncbi:MAG TPA: ABC transporter ATP-binding protein [Actinocrinis sp.]|nr:ABC transporter ATP-binding protein [Actinocrinis sp.]